MDDLSEVAWKDSVEGFVGRFQKGLLQRFVGGFLGGFLGGFVGGLVGEFVE